MGRYYRGGARLFWSDGLINLCSAPERRFYFASMRETAPRENLMKNIYVLFTTLGVMAYTTNASALEGFPAQIPTDASCGTCHPGPDRTVRNVFGQAAGQNRVDGAIDWPALCALDSDGDGASNGVELGDPNCAWAVGDTVPPNVSDPADQASVPPQDQDPQDPQDPANPVDGGADDIGGGCSTTGSNHSVLLVMLLATLSLGWSLTRRRDRA